MACPPHNWAMMPCSWDMSIHAICINDGCHEELDMNEIENRLNACEALSVEQALNNAAFVEREGFEAEELKKYAEILGGENV